ncbi:hypothetical protein DM02DRAFT_630335 [Periconia macrospinosa]|uniref:Uncharacterized protein n=1 Tax=Periconia macrospinosa TaxID=97972 RepID=A0A2V1DJP5_9PLEO|nr:hypothetical protein DM02DRAFT_630335 [Periconia macrospinosa]
MLLLLLATSVLLPAVASTEVELTSWYNPPNFRGTWDLLASCVLTLTLCVWSALHLNVPTEESKLRQRNLKRARWIVLGIFAPELVVSTAFAQFLTASWLRREIQKDVECRQVNPAWSEEQQLRKWTIAQCYYAVMGGIRIETGDCVDGYRRLSLTAEGIRMLSFLGRLPDIPKNVVRDKSKADGLAKFLVILQASWMIVQTLARVQQKLPVTLLEINTLGHILCAFALYALWWSKPLEIKDATLILHEDWMDEFVAFFYMCSPISWHNNDFISEMRCMSYTPPSVRGTTTEDGHSPAAKADKLDKTYFSIGSIGAKDPKKFIGPLDSFQIAGDTKKSTREHNASYVLRDKSFKVAPEHDLFLQIQQRELHGLQHSKLYCRRALKDCSDRTPLTECAIQRWRLANQLVDKLWNECEKRHTYRPFFFTTSTLGTFVGELVYIADRIPNFPGLSYLGSVNVHRDSLKTVVAFAGSAYGGLHLSAWNDHFPTKTERWLWIACSLATGAAGILLALFFLATQKIRAFENLEHFFRNNRPARLVGVCLLAPIFLVARFYIVVEAFISLRSAPVTVYQTPEWSEYIPHL